MKISRRILFTALVLSNLTLGVLYLKAESRRQFWADAYTQQLTMRNDVRADINLLCQVNKNLESILSMQMKWKGDWEESTKQICQ